MSYGIDGDALYVTDGGVGVALLGPEEDENAAWGPWASPYKVEMEVSVTGTIGVAGTRSIEVTTDGVGTTTIGTLSFGSATADPSITVAGPSSVETADVDLDSDVRYRVSFDSRSGEFVGKVWAVLDGEPADPSVVGTIDDTDTEADRFTIWLRAINDGGSQTARVHSLEMAAAGSSGDRVDHEWLGYASGLSERFRNRQRYRPGTLVAHVNGIDSVPIWEDGLHFRLDAMPTIDSQMHTSYTVE